MISYAFLLIWVWIEMFQQEEPAGQTKASSQALACLRKTAENFLLLMFWAIFYFGAAKFFPGRENILQAAGILFFYGFSARFRFRSFPSAMTACAAAFTLAPLSNWFQIAAEALRAAVFVGAVSFVWQGIRRRLILFSIPKKIAGLPELLITAGLISAVLSFLWIR